MNEGKPDGDCAAGPLMRRKMFADLLLPPVQCSGRSRGIVHAPKQCDRFSGISSVLNQQTLEISLGDQRLRENDNAAALWWTLADHAHGIEELSCLAVTRQGFGARDEIAYSMEFGLYGQRVRGFKLVCFAFCLKILIFQVCKKCNIGILPGSLTVQHPVETFRNLFEAACKGGNR